MRKLALWVVTICLILSTVSSAGMLREIWWQGLGIDDAVTLATGDTPADQLDIMAEPAWVDIADNYVAKMSGYLTVPAEGEYTFYVASDDYSRLYVSADDNTDNAELVAYVDGWTGAQAWTSSETQASAPMTLSEGQVLAVYAIMQEGGGGDNCAIGWSGPGIDEIQLVPGNLFTHPYEAIALHPSPASGSTGLVSAVLNWDAPAIGEAPIYDVYLGTDSAALELVAPGLTDTTYNAGLAAAELAVDTTYYWRVDVDGAEGLVWSFTTEPATFLVQSVVATSENAIANNFGEPQQTVNGAGIDANDMHDVAGMNMWGGVPTDGPVAIQFELPRVYALAEMLVWNSNTDSEGMLGFGFKDVTIEYSVDGQLWTVASETQFPQAPGTPDYTGFTVDLAGVSAKYIKLTANSNWSPMLPYCSLSEVRFTYAPTFARGPQPTDGATGVDPAVMLGWYPGRGAVAHDVSLGIETPELIGTVQDSPLAIDLVYGMPYVWTVDERGPAEVAFVEDFEAYEAGSDLHGQNGWAGWDNTDSAGAPASDAMAVSGSHSIEVISTADLVHQFDVEGGQWIFSTNMYIPAGGAGTTWFILLNEYTQGGDPKDWSVQTQFNLDAGEITSSYAEGTGTLIVDQWVELKMVIDLDNNTIDEYYNGQLLFSHEWDDDATPAIACIDLYGAGASSVYYDDITISAVSGDVTPGDLWTFNTAEFGAVVEAQSLTYDATVTEVEQVFEPALDLTAHAPDTLRLSYTGNPIGYAEADGVVTMGASGADIWGTADQCRYAYQSLTGDGEIIVRVDSIDNVVNAWAKVGAMIRQSTDAGSANAFIAITGGEGDGASFQWRPEAAAESGSARTLTGIAPPYYARLVREGNTFTGYVSADGIEWTQQGDSAIDVTMTDPVLIGIAATSHDAGSSIIVQYSEVSTVGDVTGDVTVEAIGVDMPANDAAGLYVAVEDAAGQIAVIAADDPTATQQVTTQTWNIPLSELAATIDVTNVAKIIVGVDNVAGGSGVVALGTITVGTPMSHNVMADVTSVSDAIQGVPNDGESTSDADGWPAAETPNMAIDNDVETKLLHFKGEVEPTGIQVTPAVGPTVVTEIVLTTANDAPERDPATFELYGSNEGIDGPYTLIASGLITDFLGEEAWPRFTPNATPLTFDNDAVYTHYQILFPSLRDASTANSMQIAEIELIGVSSW